MSKFVTKPISEEKLKQVEREFTFPTELKLNSFPVPVSFSQVSAGVKIRALLR